MYRTEDITLTKTETPLGHWRVNITYGDEVLFETHPTDEPTADTLLKDIEDKIDFGMCGCHNLITELAGFDYQDGEVVVVGGGCRGER